MKMCSSILEKGKENAPNPSIATLQADREVINSCCKCLPNKEKFPLVISCRLPFLKIARDPLEGRVAAA